MLRSSVTAIARAIIVALGLRSACTFAAARDAWSPAKRKHRRL